MVHTHCACSFWSARTEKKRREENEGGENKKSKDKKEGWGRGGTEGRRVQGRKTGEGIKNARHPKHFPLGWYFTSLSPLRTASCSSLAWKCPERF